MCESSRVQPGDDDRECGAPCCDCHASGVRSKTVIARSEATKQSIPLARRDGLLRFARNDVKSRYASAFPRREAPEVLQKPFAPRSTEGAGNAGCPMHP